MRSVPLFYHKFEFDDSAVQRVLALAPLFDIHCTPADRGLTRIEVRNGRQAFEVVLPEARAPLRVLAELCEKLIPWVYFHEGEHCASSLLRQTDYRLSRLVELYRQRTSSLDVGSGDASL